MKKTIKWFYEQNIKNALSVFALVVLPFLTYAQDVTVVVTTSGGYLGSEKWVSITTEVDGGGTVVWAQGNGEYGNGAGFLTDVEVQLSPGTYYVNCYDKYADGWEDATISVSAFGLILGDNNGEIPNDDIDPDDFSAWEPDADELEASFPIIVPEAPSCMSPIDFTVSNLSTDTFTLSWVAPTEVPEEGYEYYLSIDGSVPDDSTVPSGVVQDTSVVINDVSPSTIYYIWVRSVCSDDDKGFWVSSDAITTLCDVILLESSTVINEDMMTLPVCWSEGNDGTPSTGAVSGNGSWAFESDNGGRARINLFSSGKNEWIISETYDLSANDDWGILLDVSAKNYSGPVEFSGMGSDDVVQVLLSEDNGASWVDVKTFNSSNQPTLGVQSISIPLSTNSSTAKIAVWASEGTSNDDEDYYFYINNFKIGGTGILSNETFGMAVNEMKIYPNPFNDVVTLSSIKNVTGIVVTDFVGKQVKFLEAQKTFNLTDLASGMYFINLNYKDGSVKSVKIIKK